MADDPTVLPSDALAERLIIFGLSIAIGSLTVLPTETIKLTVIELQMKASSREYWVVLTALTACLLFTTLRFILRIIETARSTAGDKDLRHHIVRLKNALEALDSGTLGQQLEAMRNAIVQPVDAVRQSLDGEGERIAQAVQRVLQAVEADANTPEDHPIRRKMLSPANNVIASVGALQSTVAETNKRLQEVVAEMNKSLQEVQEEFASIPATVRVSTKNARLFRFELRARSIRALVFDCATPVIVSFAALTAVALKWWSIL